MEHELLEEVAGDVQARPDVAFGQAALGRQHERRQGQQLVVIGPPRLSAAAAVAAGALPEREAHPGAFHALEALIAALAIPEIWPAVYVRFEAGLLQDLGFGLDLSKCAATGTLDDLIYVSPRTGRAVSREAGRPYHDKLLPLPPFMLSAQGGLADGDVKAGLDITGHFLEQFVFHPLNRPLPPARVWLLDRLGEAERL